MACIDLSWKNFMEKGDESSFSIIYKAMWSLGFRRKCVGYIPQTVRRDNLNHIKNITAYNFKSFKHRLIDLSRKNIREETLESVAEFFTVQVIQYRTI